MSIKWALDEGQAVLAHCIGGVHRAALFFCLHMMYLIGIRFSRARHILEDGRNVELDKIINAKHRFNKDKEDHSEYLSDWERDAMSHESSLPRP